MALVDLLLDKILNVTEQGRPRITVCAMLRVSCEGWLKVELLKGFCESLGDSAEILAEAEAVDLTVKDDGHTVRIELKTFPTNYDGHGKPITNFIDGVVGDLSKLADRSESNSTGLAVWLAYPIPEPVPAQWSAHLVKVEAASASTLLSKKVNLWENKFAHLYVMKCR